MKVVLPALLLSFAFALPLATTNAVAAASSCAAAPAVDLALNADRQARAFASNGDDAEASAASKRIAQQIDLASSAIAECRDRRVLVAYYAFRVPDRTLKLDVATLGVEAADPSDDDAVMLRKNDLARVARSAWAEARLCSSAGFATQLPAYRDLKASLRKAFATLGWQWISPDVAPTAVGSTGSPQTEARLAVRSAR